jgi:hypothetical protein
MQTVERYPDGAWFGAAHAGLKGAAFGAAWTTGAAMSLEQAIERAPAIEPERGATVLRQPRPTNALTPREREVARLVSLCLTNRGIADARLRLRLWHHMTSDRVRETVRRCAPF